MTRTTSEIIEDRDRESLSRLALRALSFLGLLFAALASIAGRIEAQGAPGSILFFPRIVSNGSVDTVIRVANTSASQIDVVCAYLNGGDLTEIDFRIILTRRQAVSWTASKGLADLPIASRTGPMPIPPVAADFEGALICVQADAGGGPLPGNAIQGSASLVNPTTGDVAAYSGITVEGLVDCAFGGDFQLSLGAAEGCGAGIEYQGCPSAWSLNLAADGVASPIGGDGSGVRTRLAVLPCSQDFVGQLFGEMILQFAVRNEFEQQFTAAATVTGYAAMDITQFDSPGDRTLSVFSSDVLGGRVSRVEVRSIPRNSDGTQPGFVVLAHEIHEAAPGGVSGSAITGGHVLDWASTDVLVLRDLF